MIYYGISLSQRKPLCFKLTCEAGIDPQLHQRKGSERLSGLANITQYKVHYSKACAFSRAYTASGGLIVPSLCGPI